MIAGREVALLFDLLRRLRDEGISIVFISHRLEEVFAHVRPRYGFKGRRTCRHAATSQSVSRERLISMMVGRKLGDLFPPKRRDASSSKSILRTESLSVADLVRDVSIELRPGEIVGFAGMVGAGRSELALGLFGALPISGGPSSRRPPLHLDVARPAQSNWMGLVTEDRKSQGLAMHLDIAANITGPALNEVTKQLSDR